MNSAKQSLEFRGRIGVICQHNYSWFHAIPSDGSQLALNWRNGVGVGVLLNRVSMIEWRNSGPIPRSWAYLIVEWNDQLSISGWRVINSHVSALTKNLWSSVREEVSRRSLPLGFWYTYLKRHLWGERREKARCNRLEFRHIERARVVCSYEEAEKDRACVFDWLLCEARRLYKCPKFVTWSIKSLLYFQL